MNHKTTAAIGVFPSKIVGLRVLTTPSDTDPAAQVTHLIAVPVERSSDISLTIAEVLAGIGAAGPWDQLASVARFDNAHCGPVAGTRAHAQKLADEAVQPMRWSTNSHCGTVAPGRDIDHVATLIEGTGHAVNHIEHFEAAILTASRGQKLKHKLPHVDIPNEILDGSSVTRPELAALVGAAIAAAQPSSTAAQPSSTGAHASANLLAAAQQICEPTQTQAGLGWTVAPMHAPVDFATAAADDPTEFTLMIAMLAISLTALALTVLVL